MRRTETLFLVVGGFFGVLLAVLVPPFQMPDENAHYYRAYQVAQGKVIAEVADGSAGGWLPTSVVRRGASTLDMRWNRERKIAPREVFGWFSEDLRPEEQEFVRYRSASYSPVAYLPAAAAMRMGIWFKASPVTLLYAGRMASLAAWLALTWWAIRIMPFYKGLFLVLALTPMSVHQGAALSADNVTHGLAFLALASILHLSHGPVERVSFKAVVVLAVQMALLVLTKNYLLLFPVLFLVVPSRKFAGAQQRAKYFALLLGVAVAAMGGWWLIIRGLPIFWKFEIAPGDQVGHILANPGAYLTALGLTMITHYHSLLGGFVGCFGWRTIYVPQWHTLLWILLLLAVAVTGGRADRRILAWQKTIFLAVAGVTAAGVFTLLYLYWNPVGAEVIDGVQGRYFIPVVPLMLLALDNRRVYLTRWRWRMPLLVGATLVSLSVSAMLIVNGFWR